MSNCVHSFISYAGRKNASGIKNWCPLCGKVKTSEDVVVEQKLVDGSLDEYTDSRSLEVLVKIKQQL